MYPYKVFTYRCQQDFAPDYFAVSMRHVTVVAYFSSGSSQYPPPDIIIPLTRGIIRTVWGYLLLPRVCMKTFRSRSVSLNGPSAWHVLPILLRDSSLSLSCSKLCSSSIFSSNRKGVTVAMCLWVRIEIVRRSLNVRLVLLLLLWCPKFRIHNLYSAFIQFVLIISVQLSLLAK